MFRVNITLDYVFLTIDNFEQWATGFVDANAQLPYIMASWPEYTRTYTSTDDHMCKIAEFLNTIATLIINGEFTNDPVGVTMRKIPSRRFSSFSPCVYHIKQETFPPVLMVVYVHGRLLSQLATIISTIPPLLTSASANYLALTGITPRWDAAAHILALYNNAISYYRTYGRSISHWFTERATWLHNGLQGIHQHPRLVSLLAYICGVNEDLYGRNTSTPFLRSKADIEKSMDGGSGYSLQVQPEFMNVSSAFLYAISDDKPVHLVEKAIGKQLKTMEVTDGKPISVKLPSYLWEL